jgi:phage tail-like protein
MDVNGTRFHLIQGAADWSQCHDTGAGTIALGDSAALRALVFQFPATAPAGAATGDPVLRRRGGARDRYGNWYWIDGDGARVMVRSVGSNALSLFWTGSAGAIDNAAPPRGAFGPLDAATAPLPCRYAGLAITEDHYLIVGTLDQPGVLVFDLHNGGPPRHLRWPDTQPFQPFDMAARPGGGVFVLDRANRGYWTLDRQLGVIDPAPGATLPPDTFRAASGNPADVRSPGLAFPSGVLLAPASPLDAADPVAIEALPDGSVLILDRQPRPTIHRYLLAQRLASAPLDLGPVLAPSVTTPPALGADVAFVAATTAGDVDRLYVPDAGGEQAYAFIITWQNAPFAVTADDAAPFLPMRLFGGKGLVQAGGAPYYDFAAIGVPAAPGLAVAGDPALQAALAPADTVAWLPLVEQRRPRFEREGMFDTPAFDGVEPGCVWHRLLFDGCLAPTAEVAIWSRTADERADLDRAPWSPEPPPRRRPSGREQPFVPPSSDGTVADAGTFEMLFQRARGRWLQLRIRLRGDGRTSPRLRALRIWYPRFSYLAQYLPAAYREDPESASFLDRFLANLEGVFTSVEDRMAAAQALFDARTAPAEALDWLAGWFGVALDPAWTEAKRRLFLRHAMDFFRTRGTVRGLQSALRLVIEDCADETIFLDDGAPAPASIRIVEWYRLRGLPPLALGDPDPSTGIRQVTAPPPWTPEQGGAALLALYRAVARAAGLTATVAAFPVFEPGDGTAPLWHRFLLDVLSLSGTAGGGDQTAWTAFLTARYASVVALNDAWRVSLSAIAELPLPVTLPDDGPPIFDWYQFQLGGGRFVPSGQRWIPAQGRGALIDRWTQYLHSSGAPSSDFPTAVPADGAAAALWRRFADDVLGFEPGADARAQQAWRDFLARRYRRVSALNQAQGSSAGSVASFDDVTLPTSLPADGAPLRDWYDFQSIAVASLGTGHRFTVLLPVPAREAFALDLHQQRRDLAQRIVNLEKPAHTLFDVKFYWAMFRVGEARLAVDTLLDQSSRAPELMPPTVLGQAFLSESHLAATPPERESDRTILGTFPLRSRTKPEEMRS